MPWALARQCFVHGHRPQTGRGVQIVAPRSNSACAKSDARARAAGSAPSRCAAATITGLPTGSATSIAFSRDTTRSTLPSTGSTGTPNAIAASAAAV